MENIKLLTLTLALGMLSMSTSAHAFGRARHSEPSAAAPALPAVRSVLLPSLGTGTVFQHTRDTNVANDWINAKEAEFKSLAESHGLSDSDFSINSDAREHFVGTFRHHGPHQIFTGDDRQIYSVHASVTFSLINPDMALQSTTMNLSGMTCGQAFQYAEKTLTNVLSVTNCSGDINQLEITVVNIIKK